MERQLGTTLEQIRKGHVERYKFAVDRVSGTVLDAACGCGYGSKLMFDAGCTVIGIDIDAGAIAWAGKYFPGPVYIQADISNLQVLGIKWAVSFETIEHLKDPAPMLKGLGCARLICSVPNEDLLPFRAEDFAGETYPHQRHYTPVQFHDLLNACGWDVTGWHCQKTKDGPIEPGTDGLYLTYECIRLYGN